MQSARDAPEDQNAREAPGVDGASTDAASYRRSRVLIAAGGLVLLSGAAAVAWFVWTGVTGAGVSVDGAVRTRVLVMGLAGVVGGALGLFLQRRFGRSIAAELCSHAVQMDGRRGWARYIGLFVVSVLGLFLEVCLIRWHGTEFRAAAYFKNVTLLACFLGLGLGFVIAERRRSYFPLTVPILAAHVIAFGLLSRLDIDSVIRSPQTASGRWFWGVGLIEGETAPAIAVQLGIFYGFFVALFVTTILIFIPIGQLTGRMMKAMPPIRAYTINILGSIVGVLLFAAVSYLWLTPVFWFGLAVLLAWYSLRPHRGSLGLFAPFAIVLLIWLGTDWQGIGTFGSGPRQSIYSPYQRLELEAYHTTGGDGRRLYRGVLAAANKCYHLRAADFTDEAVEACGEGSPEVAERAAAYNLPYLFFPQRKRVLVFGAGAGNDVAAALRAGRPDLALDAVEIDPAIHAIGRQHHPEQPYSDARVTVHIDDARHFLKQTSQKYDLIVFGLLDSHTLLSGMTNLRLDNFVYTKESFAEVRGRLAPGGGVALSFCTGPRDPISRRIYKMLRDLFPASPPRAFYIGADGGTVFVAGGDGSETPRLPAMIARAEVTEDFAALEAREYPPETTDDWPFLYMAKRAIPSTYLILVALLAVISIGWIRGTAGARAGLDGHFFFLGAAFLLIEVKGITELALVWGATWVVNAVVITGILVLILLANLYVTLVRPVRLVPYYVGLAVTLAAGYVFHIEGLLSTNWYVAASVSAALLLAPVFFAGVIFATSLKGCPSVPAAFASNLMGAILGGLCEYASMWLGFRALYLLGLALYAASFVCLRFRGRLRGRIPAHPDCARVETAAISGGD